MKKIILLLTIFFFEGSVSPAQQILGLHIQPANPTSNDVIHAYADVSFSSGDCRDKTQNLNQSGNNIYGSALHCIGILTFICNTTDTFIINPLSPGNYKFIFSVDAGAAPSPCTPGIVAGPTDTLNFTVSSASGIDDFTSAGPEIFPVPAIDFLKVDWGADARNYHQAEIYNILGNKIATEKVITEKMVIDVRALPAGVYILKAENGNKTFIRRFSKIN